MKTQAKAPRNAFLIIDVLNDLEFDGGERVLPWAKRLVKPLLAMISRARRRGDLIVYINDTFDIWDGKASTILAYATRPGARGRQISQRLKPKKSDLFVVKPRHSAFFGTPLSIILEDHGIHRVVLAGLATNLCVLITAHDASMHGYPIVVLSDCCAAESDFDHNVMLRQLQRFFRAKICRSDEFQRTVEAMGHVLS